MSARSLAKAAGQKKYEGRPCLRGHGPLRYTSSAACCECSSTAAVAWEARHPEYRPEKRRRFRERNPVAVREHQTRKSLKRYYGLTFERYDHMFAQQKGHCAICPEVLVRQTDRSRPFTKYVTNAIGRVDHDHATGKVRGLLCGECNSLLGRAKDNEQILLNAVGYLRASATHQAQPTTERKSVSEIAPGNRHRDSSICRGSRRDELSPFFN